MSANPAPLRLVYPPSGPGGTGAVGPAVEVAERALVAARAGNRPAARGLSASDPRWVLAVRVFESLEGQALALDKRQKLIKLGRAMGLNPFEANLVIAIVQDQVRRGLGPRASADVLEFVPLPERRSRSVFATVVTWVSLSLIVEAMLFWAVLS